MHDTGARYRERLRVPPGWWALGLLLVATVWLVTDAAGGLRLSVPVGVVAAVLVVAALLAYGSGRVEVDAEAFTAGRARLPLWAVGAVRPLDPAATRRLAGPEADRRAHHLLRSYVRTAVLVEVDDAADPTPYWLVSTRHPTACADALGSAAAGAEHSTDD